jgi:hypothetical protein
MKKLFLSALLMCTIQLVEAQLQSNPQFLQANLSVERQKNSILRSNKPIYGTNLRFGQAFFSRFLVEYSLSSNYAKNLYSCMSPSAEAVYSRSIGVDFYGFFRKNKKFMPYIKFGVSNEKFSNTFLISRDPFRKASIASLGIGAYYFLKPNLVLNTNLSYTASNNSILSPYTVNYASFNAELIQLLDLTKKFEKEKTGERFLDKGRKELNVKVFLTDSYTKFVSYYELSNVNIEYNQMLSKHFQVGGKVVGNTRGSEIRANVGAYSRLGKSFYVGANAGASRIVQLLDFNENRNSFYAFTPTVNALYFLNKNTAFSLELGQIIDPEKGLRVAKPMNDRVFSNIGLKYFLAQK